MAGTAQLTANDAGQIEGTTRQNLLTEYAAKGISFKVITRPYKSRLPYSWDVVNPRPVAGPFTSAYAVLREGQENVYFGFGEGDAIKQTKLVKKQATDGDTNQSTGKATNGIEDFVIESISCSLSGVRAEYSATDVGLVNLGALDPDVLAAFTGKAQIKDPANLLAPPQLTNPANLEALLLDGLKANLSVTLEWDRSTIIAIGTADQIPEGGAKSFLLASGDPRTDNRYKVPEGYSWRAKSRTDGSFVLKATVTDPVVVPIQLVTFDGQANTPTVSVPVELYTDLEFRVHGIGFYNFSNN
jgi:hypothetical protein